MIYVENLQSLISMRGRKDMMSPQRCYMGVKRNLKFDGRPLCQARETHASKVKSCLDDSHILLPAARQSPLKSPGAHVLLMFGLLCYGRRKFATRTQRRDRGLRRTLRYAVMREERG